MYKLIIADDEPAIRNLLSRIIKWENIGFEIVNIFPDGKEVIEYLESNHADCVLCDICMRNVSGIDVAKYVYDNCPQTNVMFLSGYQDFSYATAALKYGVENYFLKPVQISEIKAAFVKLKSKLDSAKANFELLSYYRRDMLNNLANGFYKDFDSVSRLFSQIQLDITPNHACALLTIDFSSPIEKDSEALMNLFQNIVSSTQHSSLHAYYLICNYTSVKYIIFSEAFFEKRFVSFAGDLCESISQITKINSKITDFSCYESVVKLCESFHKTSDQSNSEYLKKQEQLLVLAVNSGNSNEITEILSSIASNMSGYDLINVKKYFNSLLDNIKTDLISITLNDSNDDENDGILNSYHSSLEKCGTTKEVLTFISDFFTELAQAMNDTNIQKKNILRIRNYIAKHYAEDVSLENLASMAYLSPTYFSKIFKSVVGQNYIDFLTSFRMNKAKELLLNTNMKIYEISNAVGYRNIRSFTKFFNSNYGMSPSEYRNKFSGGPS